MKKRILSLIVTGALCVGFSACSIKLPMNAEDAIYQAKDIMESAVGEMTDYRDRAQKDIEKNQNEINDVTMEVAGEGRAVFKSYAIVDNEFKTDKLIAITMDYTALNEERDTCFYNISRNLVFYQDGAQLTSVSSIYDKDCATQIKNGATIEVVATYVLRNTESDVEVECNSSNLRSEVTEMFEDFKNGSSSAPAEPEVQKAVIKLK